MNEFLSRQAMVLRRSLEDYRKDLFGLNTLLQRIEGVIAAIDLESWTNAVYLVVLSLEQVNAVALDEKRGLTGADKASVERSLIKFEALINQFDAAWASR